MKQEKITLSDIGFASLSLAVICVGLYTYVPMFMKMGFIELLVFVGAVALFGIVGFRRTILAIAVAAMGLK